MSGRNTNTLNRFTNVDAAEEGRKQQTLAMLDHLNGLPAFKTAKQLMIDLVKPKVGEVVLDAGCGTGEDTRALASLVGGSGCAMGVDLSEFLIATARKRAAAKHSSAEFVVGDLSNLKFESATFDLIRCERTLEYIDNSDSALDELLRVLKPGGRIVICETDWETRINGAGDPKLNGVLLRTAIERVPDPVGARMLPKQFRDRGLAQISVQPAMFHQDSEALRTWMQFTNPPDDWYSEQSVGIFHAGDLSEDERFEMRTEAEAAFDSNTAFDVAIMFVIAGTKAE